jgi:hypothetical protein
LKHGANSTAMTASQQYELSLTIQYLKLYSALHQTGAYTQTASTKASIQQNIQSPSINEWILHVSTYITLQYALPV